VPAPDEGRRNADPGQIVRRDRRSQRPHEAPHGSPDSRRAKTIQGVRRHRFPALAHLAAQPIEIEEAVVAKAACQPAFGRSQHDAGEGECQSRRRSVSRQPVGVDQHQRLQLIAVIDRESGGDGAACPLAHEHGRGRAGLLDELAHPRQDGVDVRRTVGHLRSPQAGKVRCDDPVGPDQLRDHPHPHGGELGLQEHDRWPVTALQHGGGDPSHRQPSLRHRQPRQQSLTEIVGRPTSALWIHDSLCAHHRLLPGRNWPAWPPPTTTISWNARSARRTSPSGVLPMPSARAPLQTASRPRGTRRRSCGRRSGRGDRRS
jgi:hypothetical protein